MRTAGRSSVSVGGATVVEAAEGAGVAALEVDGGPPGLDAEPSEPHATAATTSSTTPTRRHARSTRGAASARLRQTWQPASTCANLPRTSVPDDRRTHPKRRVFQDPA